MATEDDVRELALALPETTEKTAWGMPTFRVRGKIFVSLDADGTVMGFRIDRDERAALIASDPETYFLQVGHDDNYDFARVRLDRVDRAELAEIVTEAWRHRAPVRLRRAFDAT